MPENKITIDGRNLEFTPNETILEVSRRNGIFIPTLCYLKGANPSGACRVCVVEIEGSRTLAPACAMPAAKGMVIHTISPSVLEARRTILALLLQHGNHNCAIATESSSAWTEFQERAASYDRSSELCPSHSACKLQTYAYRYQVDPSDFVRLGTEYTMEMASPLIVRDFSRCILCGRCVDACNVIQVNEAITHGYRGTRAKIVTKGDQPMERSDCVFCGHCIQACPVAALVEKKSLYKIRPWEARHVRTTCYYCGVGCQLDLHIKDNQIMKVTGVEDVLPNLGRLCVRGRFGYDFVHSPERLTHPMIKENGELRKASWDEALDLITSKIIEIRKKEGPEAIAGICSGKSTNEALFLMQKLFRAAIGSNHLASPHAFRGFNHSIGELENAQRMILIGCDVTEENPVAGTFIKRAVNNGCRLIVVNTRPTKIDSFAKVHLLAKEGTELVLMFGIIQQLLERGRQGSEEIKQIAESYPIGIVSRITRLSAQDIKVAIDILDSDDPVMLIYGTKVASFVQTFVRLQEMLGNLGRDYGGVNYLGDLNNSQGVCDMGLMPDHLPGYVRIDDDEARKPFEDAWGIALNKTAGLGLADMVRNMSGNTADQEKRIRFLYLVGEDIVLREPVIPGIKFALESVDFLVVQDILCSETINYADVVLPVATWSEDEGTYTNSERRVSRMRFAVPGPEQTKPEIWIFTQLARRLGHDWQERSSREIWEKEIVSLVPQLQGITYSQIENGGRQCTLCEPISIYPPISNGHGLDTAAAKQGAFNYHHRKLLEQCEGLLESLPRTAKISNRITPLDPQEVTDNFIKLLEEEEKTVDKERIDEILATYKTRRGGLIPVLQQVQEIMGFLPPSIQNYIALGLAIPPADVFGVVSFYSFFTMVPRGAHIIRVCLGTACFVNGSGKILETIKRHLKVEVGETTNDREYTLDVVRCVGACGLAPTMVIDDNTHGQVESSTVVDIVESYRGIKDAVQFCTN
jgi:formate dehydrogenase major subunit